MHRPIDHSGRETGVTNRVSRRGRVLSGTQSALPSPVEKSKWRKRGIEDASLLNGSRFGAVTNNSRHLLTRLRPLVGN